MRTTDVRSAVMSALISLVLAASAVAQDKAPGLLNALEVRQLLEHADPADHARLGVHFTVLGERYTAEAQRHRSMAQSFVGNPTRNLGSGMSAHCKRLADLNTQSASTVRELAAYHEKLAVGNLGTRPPNSSRFEGGAGAPEPTERELNVLAAKARTPADHRALEEYFQTLAKRYTAEANEEATLAQAYRGTRLGQAAVHHDRLVRLSRDSATEAMAAAAMHKQLASDGR